MVLVLVLEDEFMREKRDWSSERELIPLDVAGEVVFWLCSVFQGLDVLAAVVAGGVEVGFWFRSVFQGLDVVVSLFFPMPKPGTETPALPSLLRVDAFKPADVDGFVNSGLAAW